MTRLPYKIRLRALTPIHIGTGEELAPLDYVALKDRNRFYRLTQDQMGRFVKSLGSKGPKAFSDWVSEQYSAMREIRDNRELSQMTDSINPYAFSQAEGKTKELIRFLGDPNEQVFSAPVSFDDFTLRRHRDAQAIPLGRVREAAKGPTDQPLLPGSSIKGAIRTAVFYHYLTQHARAQQIERLVREQLDDKRSRKERFSLPLAHEAFFCKIKEQTHRGERIKGDDEKMDLFKLVRCRDGQPVAGQDPLSLAKVNIFLVEKRETPDRKSTYFEATQQRQTSYCEIISAGTVLETELDFDIDFLLQIKPHIKDGGVPAGGNLQWMGITEKVQKLFGLDLRELTADNKEAMRQRVIEHLHACLAAFNQVQLQAYEKWLAHFEKHDKQEYTDRIKTGSAPVLERVNRPMLHLGYATGFDGTTALHYFLADDTRKALFKQVMAKFDLGNKPGNRGRYVPNPDRFPKSKRLVEVDGMLQPMGWVEVFEAGAEIPPLSSQAPGTTATATKAEPAPPPEPEYYDKPINPRKAPELDAVVIKSGRPNRVKVYVKPDYTPELELTNYRNPMDTGTIVRVQTTFNKKGKLVQVAFRGFK